MLRPWQQSGTSVAAGAGTAMRHAVPEKTVSVLWKCWALFAPPPDWALAPEVDIYGAVVVLAVAAVCLGGFSRAEQWRSFVQRSRRSGSIRNRGRAIKREQLVRDLRKYPNPYNNVHIVVAGFKRKMLADQIYAAFSSAGWNRNYTQTPEEQFNLEHWGGIEVTGANKELVRHIADSLGRAGVPVTKVAANVKNVEKHGNEAQWADIEHRVNIQIGQS
jgi:hypothetical protein